MKKPRTPPTFGNIAANLDRARLLEILLGRTGPLAKGGYLHWDELRFRAPPDGFTVEEWWLAVRAARRAGAREIPLKDTTGRPFTFTLVDPVPRLVHETDLRAGGSVRMPEQVTNADTRDQYYVSSLMQEAITSSQLEGATTTRQVAKEMLRSGRAPTDRSERMILNNFLTMRKLRDVVARPLTPELILDLHRSVTDGTLDNPAAAGRFRLPDEEVVVEDAYGEVLYRPPPAAELDDRVQAMCDFANDSTSEFIHPVLRSIILHFWLAYDHPFVDGNGRTARALFYWSMLKHGYWLVEFLSISEFLVKAPAQYGRAFLFVETDDNDLTYFILHQLDVLEKAVQGLHDYIERKTGELRAVEQRIRNTAALNHRQRALISDALRHPGRKYTIEGHRRSHGVVYETARSDLLDLAARKLMKAQKHARKWIFTPIADLAEALERLA